VCDHSGGTNSGRAALNSSSELAPGPCSALHRGLPLPVVYTPGKSPHCVRLGLIVALCQLIDQGGPGRAGFHRAVHGAAAGESASRG
jgi:hypothetical protein